MNWKMHLTNIYGEQTAKEWIPRLQDRIEAAKLIDKESQKESQKERRQNIILITYPDQISAEAPKLVTFEKFAKNYLKGIFDVIHFLPFCPYSSDDGFSVIDYRRLDDGLGNWEDLERLAKDYTLMFDFVCNHVSSKSEWFKRCLRGEERFEGYFIEEDPATDISKVIRPRTSPLLTPFPVNGKIKYFWTTFSDDQIDLNYGNPQVLYEIMDIFLSYLEKGGRWIRLDAIGFLWKEIGTSCMHHEKTHEIVKLMRSVMEEVCPEGRIITETNVPHADNISYFGNGTDESHMVYQFPLPMLVLYSFFKQDARLLTAWAAELELPSDKTGFFNFLASHDGIGINPIRSIVPEEEIEALVAHLQEKSGALISYKEDQDGRKSAYEVNVSYFSAVKEDFDFATAKQRFLMAHAVLFGMKGDPAVYIHSYLGTENYTEGVLKTGMNRTINRRKFTYDELMSELNRKDGEREQIRSAIEKLIRIRKGCDAFDTHAAQEVQKGPEEMFCFIRRGKSRTVQCLYNFSAGEAEMECKEGTDLLTGEKTSRRVVTEPYGFRWILI